jgi:hypothetical protein
MTPNTTPEKPEWFELVDSDAPSAQVVKVNKKLPILAVLVTGAVIATGAFFANASESGDHQNQEIATNVTSSVEEDASLNSDGTSVNSGAIATGGTSIQDPQQTTPKAPSHAGADKGTPIAPPTGGGDHEDDGDGEGREHRGDGDHEGREHGDRASAPKIPSTTSSKSA